MGVLISKRINSWEAKVTRFYLLTSGLSDSETLNKYILKFQYAAAGVFAAYLFVPIVGLCIRISARQFSIVDMIAVPAYFCCFMQPFWIFTFIYKIKQCMKCKENFNQTLHCFTQEEEAVLWEEDHTLVKGLALATMFFSYASWFGGCVASPFIRFNMPKLPKIWTSFVIYTLGWFPFDPMASRVNFWFVLVSEGFLVLYMVHCVTGTVILLQCATWSLGSKFKALGSFLENLTVPSKQQEVLLEAGTSKEFCPGLIEISAEAANEKLKDALRDVTILYRHSRVFYEIIGEYTNAVYPLAFDKYLNQNSCRMRRTKQIWNERNIVSGTGIHATIFYPYYLSILSDSKTMSGVLIAVFVNCLVLRYIHVGYGGEEVKQRKA